MQTHHQWIPLYCTTTTTTDPAPPCVPCRTRPGELRYYEEIGGLRSPAGPRGEGTTAELSRSFLCLLAAVPLL